MRVRLAGLVVVLGWGASLYAATQDGPLRVEVITAYNLIVDSNAGTPSSYAPRSAYIGVTFHNDGATALNDVFACIGNYNGGTGATPGIYPARTHADLMGPLDGGAFAFTHEGGSAGLADATRYLASIPAGESVTVYWLVGYDQLDVHGTPLWGDSVKPDDDLWLEYDVWATAREGATERTVDLTRTMTFRNEITASANKIFPNGANKVPTYYKELLNQYVPVWTNANYDGTVGTRIITEGIWYDFGNVGFGFDNDGDLVPDRNAWMQPVGDPALFDAGAFRLIKTYAMVIVKLIGGGERILTGEDLLYFEHIPDNNGVVGYVRYDFMPLVARATSMTTPYQEVASGYDNEKYNADYGVSLGDRLYSGVARATIDKTADKATVLPGNNIAYTVAFTNAGEVALGDATVGLPLVVQDSIPDGVVYVAGSATSGNIPPDGLAAYQVLYSSDGGATWSDEEPVIAASVTDLQWWLSAALPVAGTGIVRFTVAVDNPYEEPSPLIVNVAGLSFGNGVPFDTDDAQTLVLGANSVGDTLFADTGVGTGASLGNGVQEGLEPGLPGIAVYLYADENANGIADAGETLLATTESDSSGAYLFDDLPDGRYAVVVDYRDSSVPDGYTITTPSAYAVNLDSARADANPVSVLTADFGFAPALVQTKDRVGSGPLLEGWQVTYLIPVTNRLAGTGEATPQPARYTVWPTNALTSEKKNEQWLYYENLFGSGEPDGQYAVSPWNNVFEWVVATNYQITARFGSITNVTLLLPYYFSGTFLAGEATATISVYADGALLHAFSYDCSTLPASATLALDITGDKASWDWSDFDGATLSVRLRSDKHGNPGGDAYVDTVGFRLTTDAVVGGADDTTLDPVPLLDSYDPARLQFVVSEPPADSVATNSGVGELRWSDLGPIYAGGGRLVAVTFKVLEPPGNVTAPVTNTACITNAWFFNGLPANDTWATNIATVLPAGTIGDFVWRDLDGDGAQDAGEPGVASVTVSISAPGINLGNGAGAASNVVTDANGYYLFEALPATANYTVAVVAATLPGGSGTCTGDRDATADGTTVVALDHDSTTGGDTILDADFGYNLLSVIRGTLWHDLDRDAWPAPEGGEPRLTGVLIRLFAADGTTLLATTNTAANGTYAFYGYTAGTYVVEAVTNTGDLATGAWARSYDTDGVGSVDRVGVTLVAGGEAVADFSYYLIGALTVGDTLFYDMDGNGVQDNGEPGIGQVTVHLYEDENLDGVVTPGVDAHVGSTSTATNGFYLFSSLPAGNYQVVVDQGDGDFPAQFVCTADPQGALDGRSSFALSSSRDDQDFGFQPFGFNTLGDTVFLDLDLNGVQSGYSEFGIPAVPVTLELDMSGNGNYSTYVTVVTDANGHYLFSQLPDGAYRVFVDPDGGGLPHDPFDIAYSPTTPTSYYVGLAGGESYLDADFGFAPLCAIGDTVYWDYNANGGQDWSEPGIPGVTVRLYDDANGNRFHDSGETLLGTRVTDDLGRYTFTGLTPGDYVVVVDPASPPLAGATLTADPDLDGEPCPVPPTIVCDGAYGTGLLSGNAFTGADFGYCPPGGMIGDTLWIDLNTNGVREADERGIPAVTVLLYTNHILAATNVTDIEGTYLFSGLPDATYRVTVLVADPDFPAGLSACCDADGAPDGETTGIVVSGGHVTMIDGKPVSDADLMIDFGYVRAGNNALSGTVGMDDASDDGLLNGMNPSGTSAGEYPFAHVPVYVHLWRDDGDNTVEAGETEIVANASTGANGDYAFTGLPDAVGAYDRYLVTLAAPAGEIRLTTATGDTPALWVGSTVNAFGWTLAARQAVTIAPSTANIDFAFETTVVRDFGDLPSSYGTTVADTPTGPRHYVKVAPNLYLGAGVDAETDGQPSADATGDGGDEDGVVMQERWIEGGNSGHVAVTVGAGSGWLVGYIDFNQDGVFTNANEQVINQAVDSEGTGVVYALSFPIPAGTFRTNSVTVLNARFRLLDKQPVLGILGSAANDAYGEVEDYQFVFGAIGDRTWFDMDKNGVQDAGEPALTNVTVQLFSSDDTLLGTAVSDADGRYLFTGLSLGTYYLAFSASTNYALTTPQAGGAAVDSDPATNGVTAFIVMSAASFMDDVDAGYQQPSPTSSGIDLQAFQGAEGVVVEFMAYDVEEDGYVTLYLVGPGDTVLWYGTCEVTAGPRQVCRFLVPGLMVGGAYDFVVQDEVNQFWEAYNVQVTPFSAEMVRMSLAGVTLAFPSLPEREYEIQWVRRLGDVWQTVTNVLAEGERTTIVVPHPDRTSPSGFFRIRLK
jgi:uncharacterized repeat protein (TIGR01451 family)